MRKFKNKRLKCIIHSKRKKGKVYIHNIKFFEPNGETQLRIKKLIEILKKQKQ